MRNAEGFKELLYSQEKLLGINGTNREYQEAGGRNRNDYQRDYARVMYSSSFRRLQGKMQLMPIDANKFNRNRLTHSLEVAQIARSIAEKVGAAAKALPTAIEIYTEKDLYVIEVGALSHDIGNTPFGHHGERVLNELMAGFGGFEGNAQSIRNLMRLEKKFPTNKGLNLTIRSLLSIIKYNVPFSQGVEKFLYQEDYKWFSTMLSEKEMPGVMRTIDVQIVDAADEIAYCAHDLEDALSEKYFSIEEFIFDLREDSNSNEYPYSNEVELFKTWVNQARAKAELASNYRSSEEYSFIFRKELTSIIVNELIENLDILHISDLKNDFSQKTGTSRTHEIAFKNWRLVRGIKHCTFKGINRSNKIQIYEKKGEAIIKGLFDAYSDKGFNKGMSLLPVEFRVKGECESKRRRAICDYIAGMMDTYALEKYESIYGKNNALRMYVNK